MQGNLVHGISNSRAEAAALLQILDGLAASPVADNVLDHQAQPNRKTGAQVGRWW